MSDLEAYLIGQGIESVLIDDCSVPTRDICKVIHNFSHNLILVGEDGQNGYPGTSLFLKRNSKLMAISSSHQIRYKGKFPDQLDNIRLSVGIKGDDVRVVRIATDSLSLEYGMDLALYEIDGRTNLNMPVYGNEFFPVLDSRIYPNNAHLEILIVCGYPASVHESYGPSEVIEYPNRDADGNIISDGHVMTTNVIISARMIENRTKYTGMHSLELLCDESIDVDGLSGSPVYYIGKETSGDAFLGLAGMVVRGTSSTKILNFAPATYLRSQIDSFCEYSGLTFARHEDLTQEQLQAVARFMAERLMTGSAGVVPGTLKTLTDQGRDYPFVLLQDDCVYAVSPIENHHLVLDADGRPLGCPSEGLLYLSDVEGNAVVRLLPTPRYKPSDLGLTV
ncbi:hypothetical protein NKW55_15600 [Gluconobacter kondonii]|uniref:hypothetical protein n=1 Tax=Gluconobacter kondonii TaxID=941463 RepID=UPI0020A04F16|nr:hypothetical protein [Gluconobacter kondonii]MCP1237966.1 hypothetical protein [Gluconobacter kondonii]